MEFRTPSTFTNTQEILSKFSLIDFNKPDKVIEYCNFFSIKQLCRPLEIDKGVKNSNNLKRTVTEFEETPYEPEYADLCRLHYLALSRRCINILEFGSGFSTAILADAMRILHSNFRGFAKENIRAENPFHVFSIEEEQRFVEITQKRLGKELSKFATVSRSSVDITLHDNRVATFYSKLPNISPDFIYLDGPSQFGNTSEIRGLSFNSVARMPMSADILSFEFFLEPGTLILIDGRTANARFLKTYLKREWKYIHDTNGDIHYFELQEKPLGPFNKKKLEFCLNNNWMLD